MRKTISGLLGPLRGIHRLARQLKRCGCCDLPRRVDLINCCRFLIEWSCVALRCSLYSLSDEGDFIKGDGIPKFVFAVIMSNYLKK